MQAGIVQKIFLDHYHDYESGHIPHSREKDAAISIMTCKTPAQGYHIDACPNDDYEAIVFNSCKHRGCPMCGAAVRRYGWNDDERKRSIAHTFMWYSPSIMGFTSFGVTTVSFSRTF